MAEQYVTKDVWEEFNRRFDLFSKGVDRRLSDIEKKLKTPKWIIGTVIALVVMNLTAIGVFATLFAGM